MTSSRATSRAHRLPPAADHRAHRSAACPPLPDDLVHTSLLAELLAAFESKINADFAAITTPPPFPQQVAAGGNGVLLLRRGCRGQQRQGAVAPAASRSATSTHDRLGHPGRTLRDRPPHRQHRHGDERQPCQRHRDDAPRHGHATLHATCRRFRRHRSSPPRRPTANCSWARRTARMRSSLRHRSASRAAPVGARITGTISNQSDLQNALNAKLVACAVVRDEPPPGVSRKAAIWTSRTPDADATHQCNLPAIGTLARDTKPRRASSIITSGTVGWRLAIMHSCLRRYAASQVLLATGQLLGGQPIRHATSSVTDTAHALHRDRRLGQCHAPVHRPVRVLQRARHDAHARRSSLLSCPAGNLGIGTTTPWARLSITELPPAYPRLRHRMQPTPPDFASPRHGNVGIVARGTVGIGTINLRANNNSDVLRIAKLVRGAGGTGSGVVRIQHRPHDA